MLPIQQKVGVQLYWGCSLLCVRHACWGALNCHREFHGVSSSARLLQAHYEWDEESSRRFHRDWTCVWVHALRRLARGVGCIPPMGPRHAVELRGEARREKGVKHSRVSCSAKQVKCVSDAGRVDGTLDAAQCIYHVCGVGIRTHMRVLLSAEFREDG
eukprot:1903437-Pyramimonas_sp.AAC.1